MNIILSEIFTSLLPYFWMASRVLSHVSIVVSFVLLLAVIIIALRVPLLRFITILPYRILAAGVRGMGIGHSNHRWSVVYDSVTKQPVDPAYVTVRDTQGRIISTAITDLDGRFALLLPRGIYRIDVEKGNYIFPSKHLSELKTDGTYTGLYFGETITVTDAERAVVISIPLDPVAADWNQKAKAIHHIGVQRERESDQFGALLLYSLSGSILSLARWQVLNDHFAFQEWVLFSVCVWFLLFHFITHAHPYYHSVVIHKEAKTPVPFVLVRIFSARKKFEVAHKMTSITGEFICLVPRGRYYVTIEARNVEGKFEKILTSPVFIARGGYIGKRFEI